MYLCYTVPNDPSRTRTALTKTICCRAGKVCTAEGSHRDTISGHVSSSWTCLLWLVVLVTGPLCDAHYAIGTRQSQSKQFSWAPVAAQSLVISLDLGNRQLTNGGRPCQPTPRYRHDTIRKQSLRFQRKHGVHKS
jgi:hypothetical protein